MGRNKRYLYLDCDEARLVLQSLIRFKNNSIEAADPLGKSVKSYADEGKLIDNYNYLPDDHYSVLGAKFQKWLAGDEDRTTLAKDIETYWKSAKFTGATA